MRMTLKQLRAGTSMKQADVAKILGVNSAIYAAWEMFNEDDLRKLAKLFKVNPSDIIVPKPVLKN